MHYKYFSYVHAVEKRDEDASSCSDSVGLFRLLTVHVNPPGACPSVGESAVVLDSIGAAPECPGQFQPGWRRIMSKKSHPVPASLLDFLYPFSTTSNMPHDIISEKG